MMSTSSVCLSASPWKWRWRVSGLAASLLGAVILLAIVNLVRRGHVR